MNIKQQFIIVETALKGSEYKLTIYENKGKGKIVKVGTTTANRAEHFGASSEAWQKIISLKALKPSIKKLVEPEHDLVYYNWQHVEKYGVELKML
jgi:hypothetical protein